MTISRSAIVFLLASSAGLPYAAPAVCAAFRSDMADPHMATMHEGPRVTAEASPSGGCDFAECATAPVAPLATLAASSTVVPVVDVTLSFPGVAPDIDPTAPLTPPPIA